MAEAFTLPCLGKIGDILLEEIRSCVVYVCCFNSYIKELEKNLEELQTTQQGVQQRVDDDLIKVRAIASNVEAWQESAREVSNEVKGILQEKPKVKEGCLNGWCPNLKMRYSLSRKAVKKTKAIDELLVKAIQHTKFSCSPPPACMRTIANGDFTEFESREPKMKEIIEALMDDEINLIGISGLPGVGKTKMAKEVGRRMKEEKLFDEVALVVVRQNPDLRMVQNSIANCFGLADPKIHDDATTIASLLRERLLQKKKRILLILDDVWKEFDLEEQGIPVKSANGTFKFLYSSRSRDLWHDVPTKKEITLELLSKEEAGQLFRDKVRYLDDAPELEGIANKIVNKCGCLPLMLEIIGGILSRKSSKTAIMHRWADMLDSLTHINRTPPDEDLSKCLELSYKYLEGEGKRLFLLCCIFEEDKSIAIEDLARYALGLSLFDKMYEMSRVRHRVFTLVDDLKRCNLLSDGDGPQSVKVHDVVREMGQSIAFRDKVALVIHTVESYRLKQNMYEDYTYISVILGTITELHEGFKCRDPELLLLQCRKLEKLQGKSFEGMEKLKVLEIKYFHGNLTLQYLGNLTMLSLEGFGGVLDNISVIGELVNLEILSFRGSSIKEVPEEVQNLVNLRLLDLSRARMWIPPDVISHLTGLEELYIGDSYINAKELKLLSNLKILQIVESKASGPSEVTENISPGLTTSSSVMSESEFTKAQDDANHLHRAFQGNTNGRGCNKSTILQILVHRNATQRSLIRLEYETKFSEELDNRLSEELGGDLKRALLLWMDDPTSCDAKLVKHGLSKNLNVAIEVICSHTSSQIKQLKKTYHTMFGSNLEEDIESQASGETKKLLLRYVGTTRSEDLKVDAKMVDEDATDLFKDGELRHGTINEETFIRIFSERSSAHLAAINTCYREMYVHSLKKAVKRKTSSNFKCALLTILKCAENPGKYFAKALHKAMKSGVGIHDETLSRIIVSRAEVDIEKIKAEYLKRYEKSLTDVVHSDTSGHYRAFLRSLLGVPPSIVSGSLELTILSAGSVPPEATTLPLEGTIPPNVITGSTVSVPLEVSATSTEIVPLNKVESIKSVPLKIISESIESVTDSNATTLSLTSIPPESSGESTESVHLEVTSEAIENVPTTFIVESTESDPSELTAKPKESVMMASTLTSGTPDDQELITKARDDATNLNQAFAENAPLNTGESIESAHLEVTSESIESVPPEVTILPSVGVPPKVTPRSTVSVPLEVHATSTESAPLNTGESIGKSIGSVPLEVISESIESIPMEVSTLPPVGTVLSKVTTGSIVDVLLELSVVSTESVPLNTVESTGSAVTTEATENVPPNATTMSLTSVPREPIVESTGIVHPEVTSKSTKSNPTMLVVPSTESAPSEVTTKPTEGVVPDPELITKARDDAINLNRAFAGNTTDMPFSLLCFFHSLCFLLVSFFINLLHPACI
ncbi:uncharacterized protein LOC131298700 [Rhododendron vialii]|uniref:uncharacterized protein LOC131298700 n=1 Tax=Rhododendron vialii TaxID=182163 RepID=UPI00265EA62B|nr:uncharacterized protein LOC131298700 [Rhododendron vialii]